MDSGLKQHLKAKTMESMGVLTASSKHGLTLFLLRLGHPTKEMRAIRCNCLVRQMVSSQFNCPSILKISTNSPTYTATSEGVWAQSTPFWKFFNLPWKCASHNTDFSYFCCAWVRLPTNPEKKKKSSYRQNHWQVLVFKTKISRQLLPGYCSRMSPLWLRESKKVPGLWEWPLSFSKTRFGGSLCIRCFYLEQRF